MIVVDASALGALLLPDEDSTLATDLSAYDAAYIELALRRSAPLLTGDRSLAKAAIALEIAVPFDP